MYIKQLTLTNIGSYRHTNVFDLTTQKSKNVILIGGKNGAGKTTFLEAVKLGLFGASGYGYRTENDSYFKQVTSLLNNEAQRSKDEPFAIAVLFEQTEDYVTHTYQLTRTWTNESKWVETVTLERDGHLLSKEDVEQWLSQWRALMPPQLLDFTMFDGEKISRILKDDRLNTYLRDLLTVVFNWHLFEGLENDLTTYASQQINQSQMTDLEKTIVHTNQKKQHITARLQEVQSKREDIERQRSDANDTYQEAKLDFSKHGGLQKEERERLLKRIAELETERKRRVDEVQHFLATTLPLLLVQDLIGVTRRQMEEEESLQLAQQVDQRLSDQSLSTLFESSNLDLSQEQIQSFKKALLLTLTPAKKHKTIHAASLVEKLKIEQVYEQLQQPLAQQILDKVQQNRDDLQTLRDLRQMLQKNDATSEFSELLLVIEDAQQKIAQLEQQANELYEEEHTLNQQLEEVTDELHKLRLDLRSIEKTSSSLLEAERIIALSQKYRELQSIQTVRDIAQLTKIRLNRLMQKGDYISSITIDPETYEVTLYDRNGYFLDKQMISAGEQQLLLMSLIWAIFDLADRTLPFVFDTLLGRLDQTHKKAILDTFIPEFAQQTIILSTDSEIDGQHYKTIAPYVAQEYTLTFSTETHSTEIGNAYYHFLQGGALNEL